MVSLRRYHRSRQASWSLHDTSSLDTMSIAHSETSASSSSRARVRDTGFPESFCGSESSSLFLFGIHTKTNKLLQIGTLVFPTRTQIPRPTPPSARKTSPSPASSLVTADPSWPSRSGPSAMATSHRRWSRCTATSPWPPTQTPRPS